MSTLRVSKLDAEAKKLIFKNSSPRLLRCYAEVKLFIAKANGEWLNSDITGAGSVYIYRKGDDTTYGIQVVTFDDYQAVFSVEIHRAMEYLVQTKTFHTFEVNGKKFGLFFSYSLQAETFNACVTESLKSLEPKDGGKQKKTSKKNSKGSKRRKPEISNMINFKHANHIPYNPETGFDLDGVPKAWLPFFEKLHARKNKVSELKDKPVPAPSDAPPSALPQPTPSALSTRGPPKFRRSASVSAMPRSPRRPPTSMLPPTPGPPPPRGPPPRSPVKGSRVGPPPRPMGATGGRIPTPNGPIPQSKIPLPTPQEGGAGRSGHPPSRVRRVSKRSASVSWIKVLPKINPTSGPPSPTRPAPSTPSPTLSLSAPAKTQSVSVDGKLSNADQPSTNHEDRKQQTAEAVPELKLSRADYARLRVAYSALQGLAYCHSKNVLHNDVRADNILVATRRRKLVDSDTYHHKSISELTHIGWKSLGATKLVGAGRFGKVYSCKVFGLAMACKVIKSVDGDIRKEIALMNKLMHANVANVVGVVTDIPKEILEDIQEMKGASGRNGEESDDESENEPRGLLMELFEHGSIRTVLKDHTLRSLFNKMRLGDGSTLEGVLTDFGLAASLRRRDESGDPVKDEGNYLYDVQYNNPEGRPAPWLWLAPDLLLDLVSDRTFTRESDVYMAGVMLWEVFTNCRRQPFHESFVVYEMAERKRRGKRTDIPSGEVIKRLTCRELGRLIEEGAVSLKFPDTAPSPVVLLSEQMRAVDPKERPSISKVVQTLKRMLDSYREDMHVGREALDEKDGDKSTVDDLYSDASDSDASDSEVTANYLQDAGS